MDDDTTHTNTLACIRKALHLGTFSKGSAGINCGYAVFAFCRELFTTTTNHTIHGENRVERRMLAAVREDAVLRLVS